MSLIKSSSKKALKKNIETEMDANPSPKDRSQNLAIAYDVQRRNKRKKMAAGGVARDEEHEHPKVNPKLGDEYEGDNNPGVPSKKPDDRRPNEESYMGKQWAGGPDETPKNNSNKRPEESDYLDEDAANPLHGRMKLANGGMASNKKENYQEGLQDFQKGFNKGPSSPSEMFSNIKEGLGFGKKDEDKKMAYGGPAVRDDGNPGQPKAKPDDRRLNPDDYMSDDWAGGPDPERKPDDQRPPKEEYMSSRMPAYADGGEVNHGEYCSHCNGSGKQQNPSGYPENDEPNNANVVEKILAKQRLAMGGEVDNEDNDGERADVQLNAHEGPGTDISYNIDAKEHMIYDDSQLDEQPEDSNEDSVDLEDEDSHDRVAQIMKKLKSRS